MSRLHSFSKRLTRFFTVLLRQKSTRIVFLGDSITEAGVGPGGYISQLRDRLALRNPGHMFDLVGAGVGGDKVYDLYLRLDEALPDQPDIAVIFIGVNDVWHKHTHGTGTDADGFQRFYSALIYRIRRAGARIVLCTPACIGELQPGLNACDADLDAYSQLIRELAQTHGCALCDLRATFSTYLSRHNPQHLHYGILTADGVHLNDAGNELVARTLLPLL